MDNLKPGIWLAIAHLAELHRQADQPRLAGRIPGRTAHRQGQGRWGRRAWRADTARSLPASAAPGEHPRRQPC